MVFLSVEGFQSTPNELQAGFDVRRVAGDGGVAVGQAHGQIIGEQVVSVVSYLKANLWFFLAADPVGIVNYPPPGNFPEERVPETELIVQNGTFSEQLFAGKQVVIIYS